MKFRKSFFNLFGSFNDEKISYKYHNKQLTIHSKSNVQSYDQKESKLSSTIIVKNGVRTPKDVKIIKNNFNKNNVASIKTNKILTKVLLLGPVE